MTTPRRVQPRHDHGAAVVEFALVLPLLMMLVLGILTGGLLYNQQLDLTHAAREGARYGATLPKDQAFSGGANWASTVRSTVVDRSGGDLSADQVCVALVSGGSGGADLGAAWTTGGGASGFPANCYSDTNTDTAERVHVLVRRPGNLEALVFSMNVQLRSNATAKHE